MGELFAKSVHARVFKEMGTPGCATCHQNHDIQPASPEMVGVGEGSVCVTCHAADDKGGQTAAEMRTLLDTLRREQATARGILERAEEAGMEVSQAQFELNGANDALVKARAAVHAFSLDVVKKEAEPGLAISARAYARGARALEELRFRRMGLGVSLVIILGLIAGLILKIRQLEHRTTMDDADRDRGGP
jgi:predicted CXXCH cytochrome family protein